MELVFATQNAHKITEINQALGNLFKVKSLMEIGCLEELPETQNTMDGNARQKAIYVHDTYHANCFADDSGMEVEALDGRPGIYSARYAGMDKNMDANMAKVLDELKDKDNRRARFRTVIALVVDGQVTIFEGVINGQIIHDRRGQNGFGYDPIFMPDGYNRTFAEMTLIEKNNISHRAIAVSKLKAYLETIQ
ncbi:MAG: non-canonical purine NTP diphosphatase [Bacteroidota bacterium]